jgi:hypothetical protein
MFPKYKTKKWLFFKYKVKDSWEDLGKIEGTSDGYLIHTFCGTISHVGRDSDGTLFHYCPRCMTKEHN